VIGDPPYVRSHRLSKEKQAQTAYSELTEGPTDLYFPFLYRSMVGWLRPARAALDPWRHTNGQGRLRALPVALSSGDFHSFQHLAVADRELCVALDDMQELNCFGIVRFIAEAKDAFTEWFERNPADDQ